MSAAAAPQRINDEAARIKRRLSRFVKMPFEIVRTMGRCGVPRTELLIVQNIIMETTGAIPDQHKRRPEWATITEEQLGEWCNVGITGVRKAVQALEDDGMIRIQKSGRNSQYQVLVEGVMNLEKREKRSVERKDPVEVGQRTSLQVAAGGKSEFRLTEPVQDVDLRAIGGSLDITAEVTGGSLVLSMSLTAAGVKPAAAVAEAATPVAVSQEHLKSFLTPTFLHLFSKVPDDALLKRIAAELGPASLEVFDSVINARLAERKRVKAPGGWYLEPGQIKPGLFPFLARDAAATASEARAAALKAPDPTPTSAPSFVADPEDGNGEWARLRRVLSKSIAPQAFSNWFKQTKQVSIERGILRVATCDEVSADFLNQEYGPQVTAAIAELGLECVAVEFFPEGEP